jgi:tetratricopeptide (TPR) repeat protein
MPIHGFESAHTDQVIATASCAAAVLFYWLFFGDLLFRHLVARKYAFLASWRRYETSTSFRSVRRISGYRMKNHLIGVEQEARSAFQSGKVKEAIRLYSLIVAEDPGWEHGTAMYALAVCYEDDGDYSLAERCYRGALEYEPENLHFIGGLASFLYLHGDANEALKLHTVLFEGAVQHSDHAGAERNEIALKELGRKIGVSSADIKELIDSVTARVHNSRAPP